MTYRDVDRAVVDWLVGHEQRADYLDDVLAATRRTPQRAAWSFPGRWIPMQLTLQRVALPRGMQYVVLLALLALALAVALIYAGAQRTSPPPFGVAANGLLVYATPDGDIVTANPGTGAVNPLVTGPDSDGGPVFSRDGWNVAFTRVVPGGQSLFTLPADGGTPIQLTTAPIKEITEIAWSPDGSQIAIVGDGRLVVLPADGSRTATVLELGEAGTPDYIEWRPPDGDQILFRGISSSGIRLYLIDAAGSTPVAVTDPVDPSVDEFAYIFPDFDPSGTRLVAQNAFPGGVVVVDLRPGGSEVTAERELAVPAGWNTAYAPHLSPDGTRIAMVVSGDGDRIAVVPVADPDAVVLTGPNFTGPPGGHAWSPDGSGVLFWNTILGRNILSVLDAEGGPARDLNLDDVDSPHWQRLAP
jgi:Tol biopolymer transport system component